MNLLKANAAHIEAVRALIHESIKTIYPSYYPKGAVEYFLLCQSGERLEEAIEKHLVYLLEVDDEIVGVSSIENNEIGWIFIAPQHQEWSYGPFLLSQMESILFENQSEILLTAFLSNYEMCSKQGFQTIGFRRLLTKHGQQLCYFIMKKSRPII